MTRRMRIAGEVKDVRNVLGDKDADECGVQSHLNLLDTLYI